MKARTKIQLITTAFALTTALGFSAAIFWELIEEPIRLIDREIYEVKEQLLDITSNFTEIAKKEPLLLAPHQFDRYGISVFSADNTLVMRTDLADKVKFQFRPEDNYFFKTAMVNVTDLHLSDADRDEIESFSQGKIFFRVYNTSIMTGNTQFNILISRPIPILVHEVKELLSSTLFSLAICFIIVPIIGLILAKKLLKPIAAINEQIDEITSTSLNKRIPVNSNKDELQVLAKSLNKMFDRLQFSFDRQREFIGNASHDLKSPLTALMLGLEGLTSKDLPAHIRISLEKHLHTTRRISRLVYNLLELSRLEQHESFNVSEINLKMLITNLLKEFDELLLVNKIAVTTQLEKIQIHADQEKISRVIINLLDNAIKHNLPTNGKINITLTREKKWAKLEISNTGKLIPEESLPHVFDQFYRVEKSRSTEFGGSGLGLTIVKHIVELHQGHISAHNSQSGEIVFNVHLPF